MRRTIYITVITILLISAISKTYAQEQQSILSAPENWKSELLVFPLGFAPSIDYTGIEDLRFTPGWSDSSSNEYWTYTFVWYIEKDSNLTETRISAALESYFDGLMGLDTKETEESDQFNRTVSVFVRADEGFKGKIHVYDAFFSKRGLILNVKAKESFCPETNKQLLLFEFSPRDFDDLTWELFDKVKVSVKCD